MVLVWTRPSPVVPVADRRQPDRSLSGVFESDREVLRLHGTLPPQLLLHVGTFHFHPRTNWGTPCGCARVRPHTWWYHDGPVHTAWTNGTVSGPGWHPWRISVQRGFGVGVTPLEDFGATEP